MDDAGSRGSGSDHPADTGLTRPVRFSRLGWSGAGRQEITTVELTQWSNAATRSRGVLLVGSRQQASRVGAGCRTQGRQGRLDAGLREPIECCARDPASYRADVVLLPLEPTTDTWGLVAGGRGPVATKRLSLPKAAGRLWRLRLGLLPAVGRIARRLRVGGSTRLLPVLRVLRLRLLLGLRLLLRLRLLL